MLDILLVEDNIELARLMVSFLERENYSVKHVNNAEEALHVLKHSTFKIVLLDISLPNMDGFAFMRKLRETSEIPVIILSARAEKSDKLLGYELGGDDYIEKPVEIDILLAKIKVLLHRNKQSGKLVSGDLIIDLDSRNVYLKEKKIELNSKEYELLILLVKNKGKTLQKEYIFNTIWGSDNFSEFQTLTVHMKMLRNKIEENPKNPQRIITVWGVGYRYEEI